MAKSVVFNITARHVLDDEEKRLYSEADEEKRKYAIDGMKRELADYLRREMEEDDEINVEITVEE